MKTTRIEPHTSSLGMNANIASLVIFIAMAIVSWIPYLGWFSWVVPLVFFFVEKKSGFVKFQAVTAFVIGVIQAAITIILQIFIWVLTPKDWYGAVRYALGRGLSVWALLGSISTVISLFITGVIVYLIVMSYGYKQVQLPIIGAVVEKAGKKLNGFKKP